MKSVLALLAVGLLGLFGATSIGYAAYVVSRDSVGLPVSAPRVASSGLLSPNDLAPVSTKQQAARPKPSTATTRTTTRATTTDDGDDHGGRSGNSGKGSDDSSHSGDDD